MKETIRPEIMKFAMALELKMREHDPDKGDSWKQMSITRLEALLNHEWEEFRKVERGEPLVKAEEALDVGACCMMTWNCLTDEKLGESEKTSTYRGYEQQGDLSKR